MTETPVRLTHAQRLMRAISRAVSDADRPHVVTETWGAEGSPYQFVELDDGRLQITILNRETQMQFRVAARNRGQLLVELERVLGIGA